MRVGAAGGDRVYLCACRPLALARRADQLFSNSTLCKNCTNIFAFAGELPDLENPNRAMNMPPAWNIERTSNSVKSLGSQARRAQTS